jgi:aspartyl-tRNA(Asn)/glutamyl-tRNA(Gln) amidotransferase subunit A
MAKTVNEAFMFLEVISGPDQYDSTVLDTPILDYSKTIDDDVKIGVPKEYFGDGVDTKVEEKVWRSIKALESSGASICEISLPHTKYSLSSYYIIAMAEASTNLAKFSGLRYGLQKPIQGDFNTYFSNIRTEGLGEEAKRRVMLGTFTRMAGYRDAYYNKALKVRTKVINDFKKVFETVDVLAAPTMPVVAPRFNEIALLEPIQHYMMDILTVAPNLAGIPMISVPCGKANGMPVGIHLMADHLDESKLFSVADEVEDQ